MEETNIVEEKFIQINPGMNLEGLSEGDLVRIGSSDETVIYLEDLILKTVKRIHSLGIMRRVIILDNFRIPERFSDWISNEQIYFSNSPSELDKELYYVSDKYLKKLGR